jgi:hypothetical protein
MSNSGGAASAGNVQGALHVDGYLRSKRKKRKLKKEQPEKLSEVKEDWKDSIVEKANLFVRDNLPVKITQATAKYQNTPNGQQRCGRCTYYKGVLVDNCDIVAGGISENGWCASFTWRQSQRSDKDVVNPTGAACASWRDQLTGPITKAGARHNKADQEMVQQFHDLSVKLGATCDGHNAFNEMRDDKTEKRLPVGHAVNHICKVDESLGLVMGFAIICKVNGEPYYDLNRDPNGTVVPEHIPEDAMLKAATDFMEHSRLGNEMHSGPDKGTYVFAFPLTTEIAKAMGIATFTTGLLVAYKPPPDVFAKFLSGEYRGFSIEGRRVAFEEEAA